MARHGSRSRQEKPYDDDPQTALHAVEGVVAGQAVGQLEKTANSWLRRPGKQSDIRRPSHPLQSRRSKAIGSNW
jgi:hypothetical protein